MKKRIFIVIDGVDGSGKSTQMRLLKKRLGKRAVFTFDPGGTKIGIRLRGMLLGKGKKPSPLTVFYMFLAARASIVQEIIEPALKAGKLVVCDRFDTSTYTYQMRAGKHPEYKKAIESFTDATKGVRPDAYIILDLNPAEARRRIVGDGNMDVYESKPLSFYRDVRRGMKAFKPRGSKKYVVDASGSRYEVHERVWAIVSRFVK
ncbi:dTMP kinase [Candidatus Kaiserbacteria bacterium RIFCSPHIGHO2_02_FULL_55_25]|uniref:Thymidylate kinase n=1 Tax=Candidatus Kaiserbacteria bacterium RIFCSPHIGHO2_02_FULL_55_25 TaxID=1798498 RepID=A0A1F6E6I1_9BACT|nr:MAG: dTMP kinase [Candidatus Kaiserbacteria bacterium RIFCSPHIGHO2_01_FULL_55_79]OGG68802.1 MAG: dTMP kinase [Candidatus Kaiserbacteria bacterium RIFCSPHIGHO2_02_FULL_55_25]OGG77277.1 MAG: dTMP kinase [Candidatus Kaiserbacteria bacterium RIFCSPHIGHO2_12_FULL_55_13]OGG82972.1 MAG: dTMP kinase [Candidatus Kaiserbacteria bacterium RIFCSPLOWO2_01_FULL_55_25]